MHTSRVYSDATARSDMCCPKKMQKVLELEE